MKCTYYLCFFFSLLDFSSLLLLLCSESSVGGYIWNILSDRMDNFQIISLFFFFLLHLQIFCLIIWKSSSDVDFGFWNRIFHHGCKNSIWIFTETESYSLLYATYLSLVNIYNVYTRQFSRKRIGLSHFETFFCNASFVDPINIQRLHIFSPGDTFCDVLYEV